MRCSIVAPRASNRPPGRNPLPLEGPPSGVAWTSATSNAGGVAAGWPSTTPDKRMVRHTLAHFGFIIRFPEHGKGIGRARGTVVSTKLTIIDHLQRHLVEFIYFPRKPNLLKSMGLMPHLRHPTRRSARRPAATH